MRLWARLVAASLFVVLLLGGITVYTGSRLIDAAVRREAQRRTELDLRSAWAQINGQLEAIQETIGHIARTPESRRAFGGPASDEVRVALERERIRSRLDVLGACDPSGRVVLRTRPPYTTGDVRSPDPVVERALAGTPHRGIVILHASELEREGDELRRRAFVAFVDTPHAKPRPQETESGGMMLWAAAPVADERGATLGAVYGGVLLNRNWEVVDRIRHTVFGDDTYGGKALGTVTIFQWDVRIATNVKNAQGNRAIGTRVSAEVYDSVLENGRRWHERAFVVNDWYLSSYEPITDPADRIIGILYTGILERKYVDLRDRILRSFFVPVGIAIALSVILSVVVARTIARPISELVVASRRLADGDFAYRPQPPKSSPELNRLVEAYTQMACGIQQRDEELRRQNLRLEESNAQLTQLNRNYMDMLGFVTHELKNPLNSVIFTAAALRDGYTGPLSEKQKENAERIVRNAKYLEEMIANYLSLSRIEKGEMAVRARAIDLRSDVVDPMLAQVQSQIEEAKMHVENAVAGGIALVADPALLRIVLDNLLTNAVKYGRGGGRIEIAGAAADGQVCLSVWNEGDGIREENLPKLFGKFVRLDEPSAKARKGTGLGLFISREIAEKHGGTLKAESQPGHWAKFTLCLPQQDAPADPQAPNPL